MNQHHVSSPLAPAPPSHDHDNDAIPSPPPLDAATAPVTASIDAIGAHDASGSQSQSRSRSQSQSRSRRRRKKRSKKDRNPGLVKKLSFVTHLLKTLDLLVFAEMSGLYYMECSMFRFLLRAIGQYMYLTPKDESFPFLMPASRVHALLVIIPNFICILLHLFANLPTGPDFHRGYQHGGLIVDFVGQRPSTSRTYYLLVDLAILVIQCLMLTVHNQREQLRVVLKTFRPIVPELAEEIEAAARSMQDLDAEERGVSIHASDSQITATAGTTTNTTVNETGDIELCERNDSHGIGEGSGRNTEADALLRESTSEDSAKVQLVDIMTSGNALLGEYNIVQSLVSAAGDLERSAANSLRTISYGATLATLQARRRAILAQSVRGPNR